MKDQASDGSSEELVAVATALVELLGAVGEDSWAKWIDRDVERIKRGDRYGIDHLLTAFGGMGSLNDLVIHPINGHTLGLAEISSVNSQLVDLRARTWRAARDIQRALDHS